MDDQWAQRIADRLRWSSDATPADPNAPFAGPSRETAQAEAEAAVLSCEDRTEFVRRAYRLALSRDPSPGELAGRLKRMKLLPFLFTRERLLRRLLSSVEAEMVRRVKQARAVEAGVRAAVEATQVVEGRVQVMEGRVLGAVVEGERRVAGETARAVSEAESRLSGAADGVAEAIDRVGSRVATSAGELSLATARVSDAVQVANDKLTEAATVRQYLRGLTEHVVQSIDALRFEQRVGMDQLRRLGSVTADKVSARITPTPRTVAPSDRCRVCGGPLAFRFRRLVLHDRYEAEYHECRDCHTLQVPNPYWLGEAYAGEAAAGPWTPDVGRFARNFTVFRLLHALLDSGLGGWRKRVLDFGGGYGLFAQMLCSSGLDAWGHDQYVPHPYFAPHRVVADPLADPPGGFDVFTALEVFEHLTDAAAVGHMLTHTLSPEGAAVITTELYDPATHGPDWNYLVTLTGQHVTFWSRQGMAHFAGRLGFKSVGHSVGGGFPAIVLSRLEPTELGELIAQAEKRLSDPQFQAGITRGWVLDQPVTDSLRGAVDATPAGGEGG